MSETSNIPHQPVPKPAPFDMWVYHDKEKARIIKSDQFDKWEKKGWRRHPWKVGDEPCNRKPEIPGDEAA